IFKERAISIKEERADLVKHHLWVLWTDYFKPEHIEKHPNLHDLFWNATKEAGAAKKSEDPAQGQKLLDAVDEIAKVFWETKSRAPPRRGDGRGRRVPALHRMRPPRRSPGTPGVGGRTAGAGLAAPRPYPVSNGASVKPGLPRQWSEVGTCGPSG